FTAGAVRDENLPDLDDAGAGRSRCRGRADRAGGFQSRADPRRRRETAMSKRPRRHDRGPRWGLWVLMFLALTVLILLGGWALWSSGSTGRLDREVALYKAAGEPIDIADFRDAPIDNDEDNVAVALREAAKINTKTPAWDELD